MPDSQPYQKKKISKVWLLNFVLPGLGLGTLYACGAGAIGMLFFLWVLELFFMRLDVLLFASVAMSIWGTIEVARHNQAIDFEDELDAARTLPGTMAAVDNLIDHVSKGLVSAIEDDQTVYALDTLEKKAREAELRLKSMEEKLNAQTKNQVDEVTGKTLSRLPGTLGQSDSPADVPETALADVASSGLMSFAPLFETVEDQQGLSLPLGRQIEPLAAGRSSLPLEAALALSFSPDGSEEDNPNEEAIRAWLDTRDGASHSYTVPGTADIEESSASEFEEPEAKVSIETQGFNEEVQLEPLVLSEQAEPVAALEALESSDPVEARVAPKVPTISDLMEPLESSQSADQPEFGLDSSVPESVTPVVSLESSFNNQLDEVASSLAVAGLDTPFEATAMSTSTTSSLSSFQSTSVTGYTDFLSEKDRKVTDFVDKLANTIGSAAAPQPTIDTAFEFSIPNFESSFSFDFSNALSDVTPTDTANSQSTSSKHCQRCGSDRQSDFSFCLKCGISFST